MPKTEETYWDKVSSIVLVMYAGGEYRSSEIVEWLKQEDIQVTLLTIHKDKKEFLAFEQGLHNQYKMAENEIGIFRRVKNKEIKELLAQSYDIMVVGNLTDKINGMLEKSSSLLRIGVNSSSNCLINLSVTQKTTGGIMSFVKQTLEKIK